MFFSFARTPLSKQFCWILRIVWWCSCCRNIYIHIGIRGNNCCDAGRKSRIIWWLCLLWDVKYYYKGCPTSLTSLPSGLFAMRWFSIPAGNCRKWSSTLRYWRTIDMRPTLFHSIRDFFPQSIGLFLRAVVLNSRIPLSDKNLRALGLVPVKVRSQDRHRFSR